MKNLEKFEVKNLDQITGGITIKLTLSGFFDGIKRNEDVRISAEQDPAAK